MFASSFHTGSTPFKFKLGSGEVIGAWNDGLLGMCEGARRAPALGLRRDPRRAAYARV